MHTEDVLVVLEGSVCLIECVLGAAAAGRGDRIGDCSAEAAARGEARAGARARRLQHEHTPTHTPCSRLTSLLEVDGLTTLAGDVG